MLSTVAKVMTLEMRRKLAREPFEEKIRKVGQLIQLVKSFSKKTGNLRAVNSFETRTTIP